MIRAGRQSYRHSDIAAPAKEGEQTAHIFGADNIKEGFRCSEKPAKTVWGGNGGWRQLECPRQTCQPEVSPFAHCTYRSKPQAVPVPEVHFGGGRPGAGPDRTPAHTERLLHTKRPLYWGKGKAINQVKPDSGPFK